MSQFYVTENGKPSGPFAVENIVDMIQQQKISVSDYIYHPQLQEWQPILSSSLIEEKYKMIQKTLTVSVNTKTPSVPWESCEWFVFKDNNQQGPYPYFELIKMLQQKKLYDSDFIWSPALETWTKVHECEAFTPETIKKLTDQTGPIQETLFIRRRFPRVDHHSPLFIHNQKKVWRAHTTEVSAGGCGLAVNESTFEIGDRVILHLTPNASLPAFNALCTIVSKKQDSNTDNATLYYYGVKFEALNQDIQVAIRHFTEKLAA